MSSIKSKLEIPVGNDPQEPKTLTLLELMKIADKGYGVDGFGEGSLAEYYDEDGQYRDNPNGGDTLAKFVVIELGETFDSEASRSSQIATAIREMEIARDDIQHVIDELEQD